MTRDEALARAQEALGCTRVLPATPHCDRHVQPWPCTASRSAADLILAVEREARAAALDEAAEVDTAEAWMNGPVSVRIWLRERAQAIRERKS